VDFDTPGYSIQNKTPLVQQSRSGKSGPAAS